MVNKMDKTLDKLMPQSEEQVSNEGGIRLRLRDRDMLKKRKAEAEEKATQWVYGQQGLKRSKKRSSETPGRKGRPRKQTMAVVPEDFNVAQETQEIEPFIMPPELSTEAETVTPQPAEPQQAPVPAPVFVETIKEKPLKTFFIEDLGPDEEEDMPQKRLVIDTDDAEQCNDVPEQIQVSVPVFAPTTAPSYPESLAEKLPETLI